MAEYGQIPGAGRPYGDIYAVNTPAIDRAGQMIYVDQKQRELVRQQKQKQLDDEFAKNMANVKDVDVPEIATKYNEWKVASQQAMRKKGGVSPEEQLQILRKKADIYSAINKSKRIKTEDEDIRKLGGTHPENLVDDWHDKLAQRLKTPTSQLGDLENYNFMYDGTNYNSAEDLTKAKGQLLTKEDSGVPNDDKGFQNKYTTYQFYGNTPNQVKDYIIGVMGKREGNKFYTNRLMNLPADEITKTDAAYKAIPDSQFELMGMKKPDLTYSHLDDHADTIATYYAQKAALENVPRAIKTDLKDNKSAIDERNFQQQKQMAALNHAYRLGEREFSHALSQADKKTGDLWIDDFIEEKNQEAKQTNERREIKLNGKVIQGVKVGLDPVLEKALGFDDKVKGELVLGDDGTYYKLPYKLYAPAKGEKDLFDPIKRGKKGYEVDAERVNIINPTALKLSLGKTSAGVKQTNMEMSGKVPQSTSTKKSTTTYKYKGKTFTHEQIEKAAKQNNMTVDEYLKAAGIQ